MRYVLRSVAVVVAVAGVAIACGSGADSEFVDPNANTSDAASSTFVPPPGSFAQVDAARPDGQTGCKPVTCADEKATCGPISNGCGGTIASCGTCDAGDTCGGGGTPSQCGRPACTKKTCADLDANCGAAGDGCGGLIPSCGTCEAGICGGGGKSKCGGGGGGGDSGSCVPTKTTCAANDCGPIADGCGALLNCPATCPAGQTCGGGGTASVCGAPPCVKKTCGTQNCGIIADGCGGSVSCWPAGPPVCGPGMSCGGGGTANTCGTDASCTGLCLQQQSCPGGGTTSIEGYVTSPNGLLPVPNAVVYVPNGAVAAFPTAGVACETCATASGNPLVSTTTDANGHFLLPNMPVSTMGKTVDIPVVVQLGRWRKQFTIATTACTNNLVPKYGAAVASKTAALPSTQAEGDIPLTAISTGAVDALECVFRKMGIADSEFTEGSGTGRIRLYADNGALPPSGGQAASVLYAPTNNVTGTITGATKATPIVITTSAPHGLTTGAVTTISGVNGNTRANGGWTVTVLSPTTFSLDGSSATKSYTSGGTWGTCTGNCPGEMDKYDAAIFGCVGGEQAKAVDALTNVRRYADHGGRVFATHYSYVWLNTATTWAATADAFDSSHEISWSAATTVTAPVDTSFSKGLLFATWLQAPVAPTSATFPPPYGALNALSSTNPPMISLTEPRRDITPSVARDSTSGIVEPAAQRWLYTTDDNGKTCANNAACKSGFCSAGGTCVSTVVAPAATDIGVACSNPNNTCQSGICSSNKCAAHPAAVDSPMHYTFNTPNPAPAAPALQCGRVLFSDFHVSVGAAIPSNTRFPAECNANPLTSQEKVLAYMLLDLASCVSSSPPQVCKPKTCADQGLSCGQAGDGCGNALDCGNCPLGQTCGGGGVPSQCGAPACAAKSCAKGQCGKLGDGCGGTLDCGTCATGTCGGGGPNLCGVAACTPAVCPAPAAGSTCGPVADGCGAVNNCPCPQGMPCVNGQCGAPACVPRTCASAGANCGTVADGCGSTLTCGSCIAPQTCGGGGTANLCGGGVN